MESKEINVKLIRVKSGNPLSSKPNNHVEYTFVISDENVTRKDVDDMIKDGNLKLIVNVPAKKV